MVVPNRILDLHSNVRTPVFEPWDSTHADACGHANRFAEDDDALGGGNIADS